MRLIDADALEKEGWLLCRTFRKDKETMVYEVKKPSDFPTIEERKKGNRRQGTYHEIPAVGKCAECGWLTTHYDSFSFCPNCGVRMEQ